jgi:hypothetical protein
MSVVRQCASGIGGAAGLSSTSLPEVFAEISDHSTGFHLKLVEFGAKCAARARENGGEDDAEDETVVEDDEEDTAAEVAAATITQQVDEQQEEEAVVSASEVHDEHAVSGDREKTAGAAATAETGSGESEAPQTELRDRYALGALKRVRYKLDGKWSQFEQQRGCAARATCILHVLPHCVVGNRALGTAMK